MKRICRVYIVLFFGILLSPAGPALGAENAAKKPGLLVIAHGSPSPAWNEPVLKLGAEIARTAMETGRFGAVRTALMEFSEPSIPTAVAELEAFGCSRIIAVPLFVMSTGHTHFDVPAVLGLYSSARTDEHVEEHGGAVRCRIPITLTETMSEDERLLPQYALQEVEKLSTSSSEEAIVFLAHGDPDHELLCERVMRRIASYCCARTGIEYADWAYIGVGQEFASKGLPVIRRAAERKQRVLVVGLYVASDAQRIRDRALKADTRSHGERETVISGSEILFSRDGIISCPLVVNWVVESACAAVEKFSE